MRLTPFAPRTLFVSSGLPDDSDAPGDVVEPSFNEPRFSQALLYSLLAVFIVAQFIFNGVRFGFGSPSDALSLPLLEALRDPALFPRDPFRFIVQACASPLWQLVAWLSQIVPQKYTLFSGVLLVAHAASAVAVFRLTERAFGHVLGALAAAALWLGLGTSGLNLYHDFLVPADIALALWLWSVVLWHDDKPVWALLCGLATGVCVLASLWVFALLWAALWMRPLRAGQRWQERSASGVQAVGWFTLGALPSCFFWYSRFVGTASLPFRLGSLAIPAWPTEAPRVLWPIIVFLIAGAWCWRASLRGTKTRSLAFCAIALCVASIPAVWLFALGQHDNVLIAPLAQLAPLAITLGLIGITHVLERGAARRGSSGLSGLLVLIGFAILTCQPLVLAFGIILLEVAGRAARTAPQRRQRFAQQFASRNPASHRIFLLSRRFGRYAMLALILLLCLRARLAVGSRLQNGDGVLVAPQDASWLQAQMWTKANTPRQSVFLAATPGFRTFSSRSVFLDAGDEKWTALSPRFAQTWNARYALAAPLWNRKVRPSSDVLLRLHANGVTHLALRSDDNRVQMWKPLLRPIWRNREWTIYRIR